VIRSSGKAYPEFLLAVFDRCFGKTYRNKGRQPVGDIHLHLHQIGVHPNDSGTQYLGQHLPSFRTLFPKTPVFVFKETQSHP